MSEPVWKPKHPQKTRMAQFIHYVCEHHKLKLNSYQELHQWSIEHSSLFWQSLCDFFSLHFDVPADVILNQYQNMIDAEWFKTAEFNFAKQLLSRRDDSPALISINENHEKEILSFKDLYRAVASCAAGMNALGIKPGDRVAALMPNTSKTIIAMLAASSLGAIWSSCSPDFGLQAALDRLGQIDPKLLFICDGHQYQGKKHSASEKITQMHDSISSLERVIICPTIHIPISLNSLPKAIYWDDFIKPARDCEFAVLPFNHPLYILYSSGTTGKPKCIIHGAGGTLIQHMKELGLHTNLDSTDTMLFYTTCGWMMWNWMVSALALGTCLILYEGCPTYPSNSSLFSILEEEQVTVFGTSAKYISSIEKAGVRPKTQYTLSKLRCILSTGSPLLPKNYDFIYNEVKSEVQLSSISGGTDIISCFALGNPMLPVYRGELQCIGLGMDVQVFNEEGQSIRQARGELVCTRAFPSQPIGFWNDPNKDRYKKAYFERFPGIWAHGDFAEITENQGLVIYGRSDAVLNPGGVRIGTAEIYRQVEKIDEILDSIVIGQDWEDDVRIVLFVKLREGLLLTDPLVERIKSIIKQNASPRHVPAKILQVEDIPRTISGKIVEVAVRQVVHGQIVNNVESLANPKSLDYFQNRKELNY